VSPFHVSVVISTYEYPQALDAVLRALAEQSEGGFEVIVADDGSGRETAEVVERWRESFGDRVLHVWQADEGFRVARVLNLGALAASGTHLAFLGGDCVPRTHFARTLRRCAVPGWFAATYRYELSEGLTRSALEEGWPLNRWGLLAYARHAGQMTGYVQWLTPRDRRRVGRPAGPDFVPPYDNYGFVFLARADFERVNGFDLRYEGWGGEDPDLAVRLRRLGLRCGWPGPHATLFHLWHPSRKDETRAYLPRLRETQKEDRVEAVVGLRELAAQVSAKRVGASSSSSGPVKR